MQKILLILYYILQWTWGIIMNLIGAIAAIFLIADDYTPERYGPCIYFQVKENIGGINLGMFFIIGQYSGYAKPHESGHSLQNILWGPLFPFIIGIPSLIRCKYREYLREKDTPRYYNLPPYDSIWFEGQATRWGNKYIDKYIKE